MEIRTALIATIAGVAAAAAALPATSSAASAGQHFTITGKTVRGKEGRIRLVAAGPISGKGSATFVEHGNQSKGTFHLNEGDVYVTFVGNHSVSHPNPAACTATIDYSGTFTIRGGTRRYRTASGHGTFREQRELVGQRDPAGNCMQQAPPASITAVNHARGTASLK